MKVSSRACRRRPPPVTMTTLHRKFCYAIVYGVALFVLSYILVYQMTTPYKTEVHCANNDFVLALAERASPDRFVVVALVDTAFADMAINLYEASLRPTGVDNFLFVGAGRRACEILGNASLPCFTYAEDITADVASVYMSQDFIRKMNIRTNMILDATEAGFTVLHTDLDVFFLRNPLPDLRVLMFGDQPASGGRHRGSGGGGADIAAMWDSVAFNAGFVVVRPTRLGREVYLTMKRITKQSPRVDDQRAMNLALRRMQRLRRRERFQPIALNRHRYVCGVDYFERKEIPLFPEEVPRRRDGSDYSVVHNNWIVSKEAKIYRFKEHLMWMLDTGKICLNS